MVLRTASKLMVLGCLSACCLVGCGGGDSFSRVAVSGTVSVDGNTNVSGGLIATADIESDPEGGGRPNGSAQIEGGKYSFDAENGPAAGMYRFEISITVPDENTAEDAGDGAPEGETETGGNVVVYQRRVEIPEGGSESLAVELTSSDLLGESGDTPSGEREE